MTKSLAGSGAIPFGRALQDLRRQRANAGESPTPQIGGSWDERPDLTAEI